MGTKELVEVGCGKGFFLELLSEKGFDITDKEISIPQLAINMLKPGGKIPSEKQMTLLESIYKDAIEDGFYFDIK